MIVKFYFYVSQPSDDVLEQLEDGYKMDPPEGCPYHIYSIMEECWILEPSQRPSFTKLLELLSVDNLGERQTQLVIGYALCNAIGESAPSSSQLSHQQPSSKGIG